MRIGCQTYSWQMSLPLYQGRIDHICEVVGRAGFAGLEPEVIMLGQFAGAEHLRGALEANNLELAALTLVEDWGASTRRLRNGRRPTPPSPWPPASTARCWRCARCRAETATTWPSASAGY